MSLAEKINGLGAHVGEDLRAILHEIAVFVEGAAPVAVAIESAVAPEDVAVTEVVEATTEAVDAVATKSSKKSAS
jgi:alpha/beta superfamily hydrolase